MRIWLAGLAAALGLWASAWTAPALAQADETQATIEDARWLAGRWVGEGLNGQMEEAWSEPAGGQMVGYFSLMREGRPVFYEIMLIDEFEGGLRLRVKHFNPDFIGWEEKDGWIAFHFVSRSTNGLNFTGLSFTRTSETEMTGLIRIRYGENDVREEVLRYRRAPL